MNCCRAVAVRAVVPSRAGTTALSFDPVASFAPGRPAPSLSSDQGRRFCSGWKGPITGLKAFRSPKEGSVHVWDFGAVRPSGGGMSRTDWCGS